MTTSPIVSVDWLAEHISDSTVVVFDVRPQMAYGAAHLPGAISLDLAAARLASSSPTAIEDWQERLQDVIQAVGIRPEQTVVFYEDVSGTMSAYGVWLLDAAGLGNGAMLDGGIQAWHAAGLSLTKEVASAIPSETVIEFNADVVGTLDGLVNEIDEGSAAQRIDSRSVGEHLSGAMPEALHVDWGRHLDPATGTFLPLEDLRAMYADLDPSQPTTTYCAGGFRAANTYVVIKALGFQQPRNYAPSWSEWGMHPSTPKV